MLKHIITAFACLMLLCGGCRSKIQGGTARHDTGGFHAEVPTPNGVVRISDDREVVSTTQPTVETNQALPQTATAEEGSIGGVSFKALPKVNRDNLIAGGLLIALGCAFLFIPIIKQPGAACILIGAGVITMVYPWALFVGLLAAFIWFAVKRGLLLKRVVTSVDHAVDAVVPPAAQAAFKGKLAERQDSGDAKVVKSLKTDAE